MGATARGTGPRGEIPDADFRDLAAGFDEGLPIRPWAQALKDERVAAGFEPVDRYQAFLVALDRDARDALAAIRLVLAQPAISSQLVDNLNASIHLRALLTDLFIIDEILKLQARRSG